MAEVLDLTKQAEINSETTTLDFTRTRQRKISGFEGFTQLHTLQLRWNLIKKIENLSTFSSTLVELDLYDNQIEKIENLDSLFNLRKLDLSFNRICKIEGLNALVKLDTLFLTHNKIKKIEGLENLAELEYLELGNNQIEKIENLESNLKLRFLYLGANGIEKIENLKELIKLEILNLPANGISVIEGLETLTELTQLSISQCPIKSIGDSLKNNMKLECLDLHMCFLEHICGVGHLNKLTDIYLHYNRLKDWLEVDELAKLPALEYVYLGNNSFSMDDSYRRRAIRTLPQVKAIDGDFCNA